MSATEWRAPSKDASAVTEPLTVAGPRARA